MLEVDYRKRYEICSKLTIMTPKRRQRPFMMSLLLTLNIFMPFSSGSIAYFTKVNVYQSAFLEG